MQWLRWLVRCQDIVDKWRLVHTGGGASRRPRRTEGVENDLVNWPFWILVAIDGAFDDVPELTHIARPRVDLEFGNGARAKAWPVRPIELDRHAACEMLRK